MLTSHTKEGMWTPHACICWCNQVPSFSVEFTLKTCCLCFSSSALKLDGIKRVWGREGYLAQREPVEEAAQVEVPSPIQSPGRQGEGDSLHSQTPTQTPTPEPEQEKQQLASSLFVGLASQSSVSLVRLSVHIPYVQRASISLWFRLF